MTSNLTRLPIRFMPEHAELLKSQTADVDLEAGARELAGVRSDVQRGALAKSMEVLSGGSAGAGTDWTADAPAPVGTMEPQFRAPGDRNLGNVLFRRNPDGTLDLDAAKNVVVDMVHKTKDLLPLTELEMLTLSILFPVVYTFVDPRLAGPMMAVHLRLEPWEVEQIKQRVAAHLIAEMNYNAGLGGGGDPGRSQTRS